jgi:L-cysteine:1D-myo-inositol 2-amino-2-deoxy-alpha-D-glucopyranoside ligase
VPAAHSIQVFDTLARRAVPLPLSTDARGRPELKLYVCGVTPYDSGHLGHAFTFCAFDVLVRHAESRGIQVRYVQNVTDVDDPLFERARRDGVGWKDLAEGEQAALERDMGALGWRPPDFMPRVSEEIPSIVAAAEALANQGFAYPAADGSLYFEAARYSDFGGLSRRSRRSMLAKLREESLLGVKGPQAKRDYLDFPLWRRSAEDEPSWPSPYGRGRPGWHIECSAMSMRYLGEQVDVHGGGRDLVFSHHEAERAQSESLTGCVPFARAWMHVGMVRYEGAKMSKSLGNLVKVQQTLERVSPSALRIYLASHHYRRDWSFTWRGLEAAGRLADRIAALPTGGKPSAGLLAEFEAALDDDLDTPRAIRALRVAARRKEGAAARAMLETLAGTASLEGP